MNQFCLLPHFPAPLALERRKGAWIRQSLHLAHLQISRSRYVHLGISRGKVRTSQIAVQCDRAVHFGIFADRLAWRQVLDSVGNEVRMRVAEHEGPELHHADESGKKVDLGVGVSAVDDAGEGEELGALVDLRPESVLQTLLCVLEG